MLSSLFKALRQRGRMHLRFSQAINAGYKPFALFAQHRKAKAFRF